MLRRGGETADLRSFKFHLLPAFRFRFEAADFPGYEDKKLANWCDPLNIMLADPEQSRAAFDICADLIRRTAHSRGLPIGRDASKVQSLTEAVRALASAENDRKGS